MCTNPPEVEYGYVDYPSLDGAAFAASKVITYKCFRFYALAKSSSLTCDGTNWTGTMPECHWSRETEIVFWLCIALLILLLLLLIFLLICCCCHVCRCCKGNECWICKNWGKKARGKTS